MFALVAILLICMPDDISPANLLKTNPVPEEVSPANLIKSEPVRALDEATPDRLVQFLKNKRAALPTGYIDPKIRYMSVEEEDKWLAVLPTLTTDPELKEILNRPMVPYNHSVLPRVSQQALGDVIDGNYNMSAGKHDPNNREAQVGSMTLDHQWRHTAGTNEDHIVCHFMIWPDSGDIQVYPSSIPRHEIEQSVFSSGTVYVVRHKFPVGMQFLEAICNKIDGEIIACETRVWTKISDGIGHKHWVMNAHSPFPTPEDYAAAVAKYHQPQQSVGLLSRLTNRSEYRPSKLVFDFPRYPWQVFKSVGRTTVLEKLPAKTVAAMIRNTPFKSIRESAWLKFDDKSHSFAPIANDPEQIYPIGYDRSAIPTNMTSCIRCHKDDMLEASTVGRGEWYGVRNGDDNIISWSPIRLRNNKTSVSDYQATIDPIIANSPRIINTTR